MSVLGRAYLLVTIVILVLGVMWASVTLSMQENAETWIEAVFLQPQLDLAQPLAPRRYQLHVPALLAGWGVVFLALAVIALRAPLRIRRAAMTQRRLRELEREVLELRTLPLRQHEEDEILAAEARLDRRARRGLVDRLARDGGRGERADGERKGSAEAEEGR